MSARDLMLPDRALQQALGAMQTRLIAIQRRIRFPGATMVVEVASVSLPNDPTWSTIASMTLPRGRWVISASYEATIQGSPGDVGNSARTRMIAGVQSTQEVSVEGVANEVVRLVTTVYWTLVLTADTVLNLQGQAEGATVGTSTANNIILTAAPG